MKRIAVLASGRGSNFQAVIDRVQDGSIPAEIVRCISDNPLAYALERARDAEIPVEIVDHSTFPDRASYEEALLRVMKQCNADLFILAGYMRILGTGIVEKFAGKIINIHPALLPSFPGLHAQRQAIEYGVKISGCTVHFVDEEMDHGPIILQACVHVHEDDEEDVLADRILQEEHRILPEAAKLFCEDRLLIHDRKVRILPP